MMYDISRVLKIMLSLTLHVWYQIENSQRKNINIHPPQFNQLKVASRYNKIYAVLKNQGKYEEALKNYKVALQVKLAHLPLSYPLPAITYNNIGGALRAMGDSSNEFTYHQKALEIYERSLLSSHPSLASTQNKLACKPNDLDEIQNAIRHAERAVDIGSCILSFNHSHMQ